LSFTMPENWSVNPEPAKYGSYAVVLGQPDGGYAPNINITLLPPSEEILKMAKEDLQEAFEQGGLQNMKIIEYGTKQLGGKDSLFSHFQATSGEGAAKGMNLEIFLFLFQHKDKTFRIMISDSQSNFGKHRPLFDSIIHSVQFD